MPLPQTIPPSSANHPPPLEDTASAYPLDKNLGAIGELLSIATPIAVAELDPTTASRLQSRVPVERLRSLSPPARAASRSRSRNSQGSSDGGVMVEEKSEAALRMGEGEAEAEGLETQRP